MTAPTREGPPLGRITLQAVALGIAFVLLMVLALIDDDPGRWRVVALGLIGLGFGIALGQWMLLRRNH